MPSLELSYAQMEILCRESQNLVNSQVIDCPAQDLTHFCLLLEKEKQSFFLFFCLASPFIRFHLVSHPPFSSSFTHPLYAFLKEGRLSEIKLLHTDRILDCVFETSHGKRHFLMEGFAKHPNCYVTDSERKILWSLYPTKQTSYTAPVVSPSFVNTTLRGHTHAEVAQVYVGLEAETSLLKNKQEALSFLTKKRKRVLRREQELEQNLVRCSAWQAVQHEGELIKAHLGSFKGNESSFSVQDWVTQQPHVIHLEAHQTPYQAMVERFRRAKKQQTGIEPLTRQLVKTQKEKQQLDQQIEKIAVIQTLKEWKEFERKGLPLSPSSSQRAFKPEPRQTKVYREYRAADGSLIWVGKTAKANEQVTFQLARGRDWWLHVSDYPGSHVIIRSAKDQPPSAETLQDAMQVALHYSKAQKQGEGEICVTQRKYVSRLSKGKTGQVQISKHQRMKVRFDAARYQALKERSA